MVTVRVYDSGMAWHCAIEEGVSLVIHDEFVEFAWPDETIAIRNFTWDFENNYEKPYDRIQLAATEQRERIMLPAVFVPPAGPKIAVTESNLTSYPSLFLQYLDSHNPTQLRGVFPAIPTKVEAAGYKQ